MKSTKTLTQELKKAMNEFVKHLPDAEKSFNSTIEDEIILKDKKIKLMAQKIKGEKGMCWHINYKTTAAEQYKFSDKAYEAYFQE
jgi:hypothetical protein